MNLPDRPTALICMDDIVTYGLLRGLNELGYCVPQDVSLISFNNLALSELTSPPISSIDIGIYQLGYTASQALLNYIQSDNGIKARTIIPHKLIIRESSLHAAL
ncbi:unnamed protein product [Aphanomyces euteiches]